MYFTKSNSFMHGLMFHHFHNYSTIPKSQGSIDQDQFYKLIKFIGKENIIHPLDFFDNIKKNKHNEKLVCITFDDALKSQFEIALPILEDLKLKSFFFIYSDILNFNKNNIEVIRYFRNNYFENINIFYKEFFNQVCDKFNESKVKSFFKKNNDKIKIFKKKFPIYTLEDTNYRFLRDVFLGEKDYYKIIQTLYLKYNFDAQNIHNKVLLNKVNINLISDLGHEIGLHSHNHPTKIENYSLKNQLLEYSTNLDALQKILKNKNIISMSHPCGSYNSNTLELLEELNIFLGFKESMLIDRKMTKINNSNLEIARVDHSSIIKNLDL
jgi:peptidoglycan/xylan/chitin deacetylase (PgdA/CDA1 family)